MNYPLLNYPVKLVVRGPSSFNQYYMKFCNLEIDHSIASLFEEIDEYFTAELKINNEDPFDWNDAFYVSRNQAYYKNCYIEMPREEIDPYKSFYEIFGDINFGEESAIIEVMPKSMKKGVKVYISDQLCQNFSQHLAMRSNFISIIQFVKDQLNMKANGEKFNTFTGLGSFFSAFSTGVFSDSEVKQFAPTIFYKNTSQKEKKLLTKVNSLNVDKIEKLASDKKHKFRAFQEIATEFWTNGYYKTQFYSLDFNYYQQLQVYVEPNPPEKQENLVPESFFKMFFSMQKFIGQKALEKNES